MAKHQGTYKEVSKILRANGIKVLKRGVCDRRPVRTMLSTAFARGYQCALIECARAGKGL